MMALFLESCASVVKRQSAMFSSIAECSCRRIADQQMGTDEA